MADRLKKTETMKELRCALSTLRKQKEELDVNMRRRDGEIAKLRSMQVAAESQVRGLGRQIAETANRIFVRSVLNPELIVARRALLKKMSLAVNDGITVAKQKALQKEVIADRAALQKLCKHPFVFSYDGYAGSHSMGYDDAYHGRRSGLRSLQSA